MWFWLARIIIGRSQHESTRRGVDNKSVAMYGLRDFHPVSEGLANQVKLSSEIRRLWANTVGQSHLFLVVQAVKTSITVGMRIFSIVAGSSFLGGLTRGFGLSQLGGQVLHWLHRLKA